MSPLSSKLDEVRRRVRHLILLRGLAWLLAIIILLTLAACCADVWWRLNSTPLRALLLALIAFSGLAGAGGWLVYPWLKTITNSDLAWEMERSQGRTLRSLTSGVEFDDADCRPECGSPSLQHVIVARQSRRLAAQDVVAMIDTRPVQRAVVWALGATLLAGTMLLANRPRAGLALHRLFLPLNAPNWPREHTLRLLDDRFQPLDAASPVIVAAGRPPTFYVDDSAAELPDQIVLQVEQEDGKVVEQSLVPRTVDRGTSPRRLAAFSISPRAGNGRMRAVGGDDHRMPWHSVRCITPPAIEKLDVIVHPPGYAQQPKQTLTSPSGPVEALIGTVIEVELTPGKSLQKAVLRRDAQPDQKLHEQPGAPGTYTASWDVRDPGRSAFWFELTDQFGLQNLPATRFEVIGVEDREPVVSIEHPPLHMTLTPSAVVPLRCVAEDDVGLTQVRLLYSDPPGSEGTQPYPLPPVDGGTHRADLESTLSMADLKARPGTQITFRAEALDGYDLGPAHVSQSERHTVLVVTPEEKLEELLNREVGVAEAIDRAVALETDSERQTRQLRLQWELTSRLRPQDQDLLSRVIHDSSRTEGELYDDQRGAASRVSAIRAELNWNRIEDEATRNRLATVSAELERLRTESLPELQRLLAAARKSSAVTAPDGADTVAEELASAESMQVEVRETLQILLGLLRGWRERYDLVRSLTDLTDQQGRLNAETAGFGQPLLQKERLDEQDEANFARLADRQQDLARQLQQLAESATESVNDVTKDDSADRESLLRLADAVRQTDAGDAMVRATELLRNHNIGETMTTQAAALDSLRSLTESLDRLAADNTETLLKQIRSAEEEVETLRRRQSEANDRAAGISTALPESAQQAALERLRREQQQLAAETAESAMRLRKQNFTGPATSSSRAADAMRSALEELQDGVTAAARNRQQRALDQLEQAREELARLRRDIELQHALQQASQWSDLLDSYRTREQQLQEQTGQLVELQRQTGRLQRSRLSTLSSLKRSQSELADDLAAATPDIAGQPAFSIVLEAAGAAMRSAGERLTRDSLSEAPQFQSAAIDRLTEVIDALASTTSENDASMTGASTQQQDQPQTGQLDWTLIAQIRLLKGLQARIAKRIAELTRATADGAALTGEQQAELAELADLQSQSARAAADLLDVVVNPVELAPDPEAIP